MNGSTHPHTTPSGSRRPDRGALPVGLHPASSAGSSGIARPHAWGTNAPFDPFCEATSYAAGNGVRSVGSPDPEGSVEQERQRPCPSDPLGIWSPFGCPGDSCSSPLLPTTSAEPTTTQPTTTQPTKTQPTTTEPATTKTGPPILRGDQPALGSGATAGALLPVIGLLYLLRGLLPQPGGTHARQRGAKHLHRHR